MLNDEYSGVRSVAVTWLGQFGYRQEFTMALKDNDSYIRREVAAVLGKARDVRAVGPLREALKDPDTGVQCAAANALGEIGAIEAIDSLVPMLGSENESAQCAAATALGNIGDPKAIRPLRIACDGPNAWVRDVARKALEKIDKRT